MGKFDLVPKVLGRQLGVRRSLSQRGAAPGKPMWFGIGPQGQAVFGSAGKSGFDPRMPHPLRHSSASRKPWGRAVAPPERLALAAPVTFQPPLAYFLPVSVEHDDWGRPWAHPRPTNGSGDFLSLAGTDGFVELPPGPNTYAEGLRHQHVSLVNLEPPWNSSS